MPVTCRLQKATDPFYITLHFENVMLSNWLFDVTLEHHAYFPCYLFSSSFQSLYMFSNSLNI